ncbi:MAG: oxidoreductase [Desulfobulbus propionicus]|nr:MAG: oxidoreductase [Desulfobulbus propionicus]
MEKVYFFATCLGGAVFTQTSVNAVKLLQDQGVSVVFKKEQTCCGQPSFNTGYFADTKKIALYNIDLFSENYPVIVPSGSCAGMMKHDYVELLKGSEHETRAKEFAGRVYELSEYLDRELKAEYKDQGEKIKITWHSNCHALRVQKCIESSKNILRQFENVELIELEREEECCGFGGTFAVKEDEISNAMVQEKIKWIQQSGADYVVSADSGCLLNIGGALAKANSRVKSVHLYDFMAKRIKGDIL